MKLAKLTQAVIKMPDMPQEVLAGMKQEEIMDAQTIGPDQEFYVNPANVVALYPSEHPKVEGGTVITLQGPAQMPPQVAVRESLDEVARLLAE